MSDFLYNQHLARMAISEANMRQQAQDLASERLARVLSPIPGFPTPEIIARSMNVNRLDSASNFYTSLPKGEYPSAIELYLYLLKIPPHTNIAATRRYREAKAYQEGGEEAYRKEVASSMLWSFVCTSDEPQNKKDKLSKIIEDYEKGRLTREETFEILLRVTKS